MLGLALSGSLSRVLLGTIEPSTLATRGFGHKRRAVSGGGRQVLRDPTTHEALTGSTYMDVNLVPLATQGCRSHSLALQELVQLKDNSQGQRSAGAKAAVGLEDARCGQAEHPAEAMTEVRGVGEAGRQRRLGQALAAGDMGR